MKNFPTSQVEEITKTIKPTSDDTHEYWQNGTISDLKKLVKLNVCKLESRQNSSPSIGEFIDILEPFGEKATLLAYIIYPPRHDARVSVEGFEIKDISKKELMQLKKCFKNYSQYKHKKTDNKHYALFWWD